MVRSVSPLHNAAGNFNSKNYTNLRPIWKRLGYESVLQVGTFDEKIELKNLMLLSL
jgi:hypothetical protein